MVGQEPYVAIGYQFPYPDPEDLEKQDSSRFPLWHGIYLELKKLLYQAFSKLTMPSLFELAASIHQFLNLLQSDKLSKLLDIEELQQQHSKDDRADKLDDGRRKGFGTPQNILEETETPLRIGVLELSTRASKAMYMDVRRLQDGFSWKIAKNKSELTELGQLVDRNNNINWEEFRSQVLPKINRAITFFRNNHVDVFHCVPPLPCEAPKIVKRLWKS